MNKALKIAALSLGILFSLSLGVKAKFSIGPIVGFYNPDFSEVNSDFEEFNSALGVDLNLKGKLPYGLMIQYSVTPNFSVRGDIFTFNADTQASGVKEWQEGYYYSYWYDLYIYYTLKADFEGKAQVVPIFLDVVYEFSPEKFLNPYIGIGIGSLMSNFKFDMSTELSADYYLYDWYYGDWYYWYSDTADASLSDGDTQNSLGFQILAGLDVIASPNFAFTIEGRYISGSSDFNLTNFEGSEIAKTGIDWGGFFVGGSLKIRI